ISTGVAEVAVEAPAVDFLSQQVDAEDHPLLICHLLDRPRVRQIRCCEMLKNDPPGAFTYRRFGLPQGASRGGNDASGNALSSANDRFRKGRFGTPPAS